MGTISKATGRVVMFLVISPALVAAQSARGLPEALSYERRDMSTELANKMEGRFTVTAVGDVLMQEPMSHLMSPELLDVLRGLRETFGN